MYDSDPARSALVLKSDPAVRHARMSLLLQELELCVRDKLSLATILHQQDKTVTLFQGG